MWLSNQGIYNANLAKIGVNRETGTAKQGFLHSLSESKKCATAVRERRIRVQTSCSTHGINKHRVK
jgi:hypothetical protein